MTLVWYGSAGKWYITDRLLAKDDSNQISEENRNRLVIDAAEPGGVQQQEEEPPDNPSSAVDTDPSTSWWLAD